MKEIIKMVKKLESEFLSFKTVRFTMDSGWTIKPKDSECLFGKMEISMKVNFKTILNMGLEF